MRFLLYISLLFLSVFIIGCGGGDSGAAISGGDTYSEIPDTSSGQIQYAVAKIASNDYSSAKSAFTMVINNNNATNFERNLANTGISYCDLKLDNTDIDSNEYINSLVSIINTTDEVPLDTYVLLGAAYLARNNPEDPENAVEVLEKIGGGPNNFNPNFTFNSELNLDISNAEVHALLAVAYFYNNQSNDAQVQINIANNLDPDGNYELVNQINTLLSIMGL